MKENIFRTPIKTSFNKNCIDYNSSLVLFGSCFSENIGNKLNYFGFKEKTNPFGILFNPVAIENAIQECVAKKTYTLEELFFFNEQFHSYNFHSSFSEINANSLLEKINTTISETHQKLKNATQIIITLGTASVYRLKANGKIVANCHKVPQNEFSKELLNFDEVSNAISNIINNIRSINYESQIIFTVSPIRHLKDGIIENSRSKSILIAAIHDSLSSNCFYFPSYEIMNDDLRDYRFYETDMLHPNETAIEYIWNTFKKDWLSDSTKPIMKEIDTVRKGKQHRPFHPSSEKHQKFLQELKLKEDKLKVNYNIEL